ncbi:hypothetical protein [Sorangium cellulosum]|nr:hypothetical protein [Sorangium cellulosum]
MPEIPEIGGARLRVDILPEIRATAVERGSARGGAAVGWRAGRGGAAVGWRAGRGGVAVGGARRRARFGRSALDRGAAHSTW